MCEGFVTVAAEGTHETEVSRSRFVCHLAPVATEEQAREFLDRVRARHPDATHHCHAYVIGADAALPRCGDDGEPGGTAGAPMLGMLLRREVRYSAAVVARYFGGVKLGAGGLIRAYAGAVGHALDAVGTVPRRRLRGAVITVGHERAGRLEHELRGGGRRISAVTYGADVTFEVALPADEVADFGAWLAGVTAGSARLELGGESHGAP